MINYNQAKGKEESLMMEILKNLAQHELTTVFIVLGLIKEVRKLIQVILNYKIQKMKLTSKNQDEAD